MNVLDTLSATEMLLICGRTPEEEPREVFRQALQESSTTTKCFNASAKTSSTLYLLVDVLHHYGDKLCDDTFTSTKK